MGLCGCVSANARSAIVLGVESEGVGVGFRHTEGLVTVAGGVVTDVDLVVEGTARVILDNTEVIVRSGVFGASGEGLEFGGASFIGLLFLDEISGMKIADVLKFANGFRFLVGRARLARNLEGVLNSLALFIGVATFGNFGIVGSV